MKRKTFDELYQTYVHDIFRYLLALCHDYYLAQDLMNETFYRAFIFLEDCEDKVKPWLYKVAYNAFVDYKRKNSRILIKEKSFFERLREKETIEEIVVIKEQLQEIDYMIENLPENQKQAILLYDYQGFQYKEAAEIMHVSIGHFKILLFRARQKIRGQRGGLENE